MTLEMSPIGRAVEKVTAGMTWDRARPLWEQASREFAETATGVVHVFQGSRVRLESMWAKIEYEILKKNPSIKIIYHHVLEDGSIVDLP
jgi:hypothetical protein